jgi:prepilin-type N-terminal cleavage/methylation domain-containing protein
MRIGNGRALFRALLSIPWSKEKESKAGMTLIELVITLSIMAAVASIAIVTLSDMGETSRYEETERRGLAAQRAVIGQPGEISRFFNDMGRFPLVLTNEPDRVLMELYEMNLQRNIARSITNSLYFRFDLPGDVGPQDDDFTNGTNAVELIDLLVPLRAGWNGPYLLNQYDRFTDNFGLPWAVNTNAVRTVWDAGWTSDRAGIAPSLGEPIKAIRSDFYTETTSGGVLKGSSDFSTAAERNAYRAAVENQTFVFHETHLLPDLTVRLTYGGTNAVDRIRVMLYVPLCNRGREPEICEISAWLNYNGTSIASSPMGVRYRVSDVGAGVLGAGTTEYELRVEDKNSDGDFLDAGEWAEWVGSASDLLEVVETRCEPLDDADTSAASIPWQERNEVTFRKVPVGTRRIWAYAYKAGEQDSEYYSPVELIEIKPGHHVVELDLTEGPGF